MSFLEIRSMRGDEAKNVCPQIQLVRVPVARGKADLSIYRNAGSEVEKSHNLSFFEPCLVLHSLALLN